MTTNFNRRAPEWGRKCTALSVLYIEVLLGLRRLAEWCRFADLRIRLFKKITLMPKWNVDNSQSTKVCIGFGACFYRRLVPIFFYGLRTGLDYKIPTTDLIPVLTIMKSIYPSASSRSPQRNLGKQQFNIVNPHVCSQAVWPRKVNPAFCFPDIY